MNYVILVVIGISGIILGIYFVRKQRDKNENKAEKDWKNYQNELVEIRRSAVYDREILEGVFEILQQSENNFKTLSCSEEDLKEKELAERYKDVIKRYGPLLGAIIGRMNGFNFYVYSDDHGQHFHVIHKGKGIDARFSFPGIDLMDYKKHPNTIGSKEQKRINEFFKIPGNFHKLNNEFQKRLS